MKEWHKSRSFFESFAYAFSGLGHVVRTEPNIRRQLYAGAGAFLLAFFLRVPTSHLLVIILVVTLVIALEMINTVLELLQDIVHPEYHRSIKVTKDVGAAAVLTTSLGALLIGLIVFLPPLLRLLRVGA